MDGEFIGYGGEIIVIEDLLKDLRDGFAAYWSWHVLLYKTISLYDKAATDAPYGLLLHTPLTIGKKTCFDIEGAISNGSYDKEWLVKMTEIYIFLSKEADNE